MILSLSCRSWPSDTIGRVKDTRVGGAKGYTEPRLPTYEANSPSVRALLRLVVERIVLPLEERRRVGVGW